jgi:hypothetical protein
MKIYTKSAVLVEERIVLVNLNGTLLFETLKNSQATYCRCLSAIANQRAQSEIFSCP